MLSGSSFFRGLGSTAGKLPRPTSDQDSSRSASRKTAGCRYHPTPHGPPCFPRRDSPPCALFAASCAAPRRRPEPAHVVREHSPAAPLGRRRLPTRPAHARVCSSATTATGRRGLARRIRPQGDDAFRNLDRNRDGVITVADFEVPVAMPADLAAPFLISCAVGGPDAESIAIGDLDEAFESRRREPGRRDRSRRVRRPRLAARVRPLRAAARGRRLGPGRQAHSRRAQGLRAPA